MRRAGAVRRLWRRLAAIPVVRCAALLWTALFLSWMVLAFQGAVVAILPQWEFGENSTGMCTQGTAGSSFEEPFWHTTYFGPVVVDILAEDGTRLMLCPPDRPFLRRLLWQAVREGDASFLSEVMRLGESTRARDEHGETLLGRAAEADRTGIVSELLRCGAEVDRRGRSGRTPLMMAASKGNAKVVSALLRAGADAQIRDQRGRRARELALEGGHTAVAELLRRAPKPAAARRGDQHGGHTTNRTRADR